MKKLSVVSACVFGLSGLVASEEFQVGFSHAPPWAFRLGENCVAGINKEIVEKALAGKGFELQFKLSSYRRLISEFSSRNLDFASPMAVNVGGALYTNLYLPYRDVAITRADRNLSWNSIDDLRGSSVVAYQKASVILPKKFGQLIGQNAFEYKEHPDRRSQILMMSSGRIDAVVGEVRILLYQSAKHYEVDKVTVQDIFPQVSYGASVWSEELYSAFQSGYQDMMANGEFDRIFQRYDRSLDEIDEMLKTENPECFE